VNEALRRSLEPVLHDIRASGAPMPDVRDQEWADDGASAMLWSSDGSGSGVRVDATAPEEDRIVMVADQVQEWVIKELWGQAATNWPPCPSRPASHPLTASRRGGVAVWTCPRDGTPFSPVGSLA